MDQLALWPDTELVPKMGIVVDADNLAHGLTALLTTQAVVSSRIPGCIPLPGEPLERHQLAVYAFALQVEIAELLQELQFKPWKNPRPLQADRIADEFADVLAFIGVLLYHIYHLTGLTPAILANQYVEKSNVNWERLNGRVEGYTQNDNGGWKETA